MPIDPYAALNAMVRAEVARSSEPHDAARHEPRHSDAADPDRAGDTGPGRGGEEDPAVAHRP
ncbi:hypothetical protein [Streptomyces chryseus]|uniref:Uncharacterized protein n=1 Tax=Streptomyces chryseus TaxID=68186 RepID=A0ABQ3E984_9ACTN|nr:hypothetical protein [Streptomyces chryseus]GHB28961.1 hypothetical protein GCM10010346_60500 [Streptomyces chryseus]